MNILPFHLNVPAEIILERPEGTLVQGRYGDRVMFTSCGWARDVRAAVRRHQNSGGGRRARRSLRTVQDPSQERETGARSNGPSDASTLPRNRTATDGASQAEWLETRPARPVAPETPLERDLRASINWYGQRERQRPQGPARQTPSPPRPPSWSMPSKPRSRRPTTPSDTAPSWATWSVSMRTPSSPWRSRY